MPDNPVKNAETPMEKMKRQVDLIQSERPSPGEATFLEYLWAFSVGASFFAAFLLLILRFF